MSEFKEAAKEAVEVLQRAYPNTDDGQAHLHAHILDGLVRYGIEQCLTPPFLIFLAKTSAMPLVEAPRPRPQLKLIKGGRL